MTGGPGLQEAASRTAAHVDAVFLFIAATSLLFFLLVEGMLIYFAIRYRRRRGADAVASSAVRSNVVLESIWILIPSIVVVAFFAYGYVVFRDMRAPVPGAFDIQVTARQFLYEFRYPDGRTSIGELRVPVGKPVKLTMTSADVIHGFYIPDYRIKQDIVPGQYTVLYLWPDKVGSYDIFCTQYCGVGHSNMRAKLVVSSDADYAAWAATKGGAGVPPAQRGREIVEKFGCLGCHTTDGTPKVGPSFAGIYGRTVALEGGKTAAADDDYIRESIYDPGATIVKGFPNVMPTFKTTLSADDVTAVIAYLKTLPAASGKGGEERHD